MRRLAVPQRVFALLIGALTAVLGPEAALAQQQVGLVNVARDADVQIGLVNVDTHGRLLLDALAEPEAGMLLAGVKHGPLHFHTLYTAEISAVSGRPWVVFGLG